MVQNPSAISQHARQLLHSDCRDRKSLQTRRLTHAPVLRDTEHRDARRARQDGAPRGRVRDRLAPGVEPGAPEIGARREVHVVVLAYGSYEQDEKGRGRRSVRFRGRLALPGRRRFCRCRSRSRGMSCTIHDRAHKNDVRRQGQNKQERKAAATAYAPGRDQVPFVIKIEAINVRIVYHGAVRTSRYFADDNVKEVRALFTPCQPNEIAKKKILR